ncbi:hypothetical protein [Pseudomonas fluorescens]|uniref:Uncharacterized protein n=1 Tax=Pseudomonas fluorescens TaxID=294 RepID=A0A5E7PAX1_PSEFL|nr:hypothetical protein [Pseudomonas fluorescens]VVP44583.1 hypothetical protein PS880_05027 [Pseudomonas fluorescens]
MNVKGLLSGVACGVVLALGSQVALAKMPPVETNTMESVTVKTVQLFDDNGYGGAREAGQYRDFRPSRKSD